MRIRRVLLGVAVTAFWLVMMAMLARNHLLPQRGASDLLEITPVLLTEQWRDYQEWMKLIVGGKSVGVSYTAVLKRPGATGYLAGNRTWMDLDLWGAKHAFRLETIALLDPSFHLHRTTANVRLDESEMTFMAVTRPPNFLYRWQLGDRVKVASQRLEAPISLLEAVRPLVAQRLDLEVGNVYRLAVLDSTWSLREGTAEVRVEALDRIALAHKSVMAYRLVTQLGPYGSTTWVTPEGEILRRAFANFVMERVDPQEARERCPGIDDPMELPRLNPSDFRIRDTADSSDDERIGPLGLLIELLRQP